jgi:hypothetical protein
MNIIIIGAGWYGCHVAKKLQNKHNIKIIEEKSDIFDNSSYYNQNRLHLGFHYPRSYETRHLCQKNYDKFKSEYEECVDDIDNNFYIISNNSIIDYTTYVNVFTHEGFDFDIIENENFVGVDGSIIKVKEKIINSDNIKNHFKTVLTNVQFEFNSKVLNYEKQNGKFTVFTQDGNAHMCDLILDCTYNQLGLSLKKYTYESTVSLIYKKIKETHFGAITIMDGKFSSLYPRDICNNLYTLTDVEHTPLLSSLNYKDIESYHPDNEKIEETKEKMETKLKTFYPRFLDEFKYESFFVSKKTKPESASDSRNITIEEIEPNVLSVNCGKIYGIFEWGEHVENYIGL